MKLRTKASLILLAIVIGATGIGIVLVRRGFSARDNPSALEAFTAGATRMRP
jgi:hypothetical protein